MFRERGPLSRQSSGSRHGPVSPRRTEGDAHMSTQSYRSNEGNDPPALTTPGFSQEIQQHSQTHFLPPSPPPPPPLPPRQSSVKHLDQWQPSLVSPMGPPASGPGLGLISMPTPNPTPSLVVPGQDDGSFEYENGSSEAGVIRRQLDSKSSLRSRSIVRRRKSQFPPPKDSPAFPKEQMNAISEEQEAPAAPEVLSPPMEGSALESRMAAPLPPPPPPSTDPKVVDQVNEHMSAVEAAPKGKIFSNIDLMRCQSLI